MEITDIELRAKSAGPEMTNAEIMLLYEQIAGLAQKAKEAKRIIEARLVEWIEVNGEFMVGEVRYYVGKDKVVKPIAHAQVIEAVLDAAGGDLAKVADMLSSDPFKAGACRALLGDEKFNQVFRTEYRKELETGKPKRVLGKADSRYLSAKE